MIAMLFGIALGASATCRSNDCSAGITFSATVEPVASLAIDSTKIAPGTWRVAATDGVNKREWLVFQDGVVPHIFVALRDTGIEIETLDVIALDWPTEKQKLRMLIATHRRRVRSWLG